MKIKKSRLAIAALVTAVLAFGGAAPAHADSWRYPGGVNCTGYTAHTWSSSWGGTQVQHRAEGYGGYYYKTWSAAWYSTPYNGVWGWKTILSSRVGVIGSGTVDSGAVSCSPQ